MAAVPLPRKCSTKRSVILTEPPNYLIDQLLKIVIIEAKLRKFCLALIVDAIFCSAKLGCDHAAGTTGLLAAPTQGLDSPCAAFHKADTTVPRRLEVLEAVLGTLGRSQEKPLDEIPRTSCQFILVLHGQPAKSIVHADEAHRAYSVNAHGP